VTRYIAFITNWRVLLVSAFCASVMGAVALGVGSWIGSAFSILALDLAFHAGKFRARAEGEKPK
jgi:hypothetical protein